MTTIHAMCRICLTGHPEVKRIGCYCGGEFMRLVQPVPAAAFVGLTREQRMDLKVRKLELTAKGGAV